MTLCNLRDAYLDAGLSPEETALYEEHLTRCRDCLEAVIEWRMFERGVKRWAEARKKPVVTMTEAQVLVQKAEASNNNRGGTRRGTSVFWLSAGVAAVATAAAVFAMLAPLGVEAPAVESPPLAIAAPKARMVVTGISDRIVPVAEGEALEAPPDHHVVATIEKDSVALSSKGRMKLIKVSDRRVRLGLETGTVACRVDKRQGNEDFVVEAGAYRVRVVGTRFSVTRKSGGVSVVVKEGAVRVDSRDGHSWMLRGGDTLIETAGRPVVTRAAPEVLAEVDTLFENPEKTIEEIPSQLEEPAIEVTDVEEKDLADDGDESAAVSAPTPSKVKKPRIVAETALWRKWVIEGRIDDATRAMRVYLKSNPRDRRVLALYADAARKEGAWLDAVAAYEKVISLGNGAEASRAMYMLASIYQAPLGRHQDAIALFRTYKNSGHVSKELSDLTDVKIARSLVALGRCNAARQTVGHLLDRTGSFVAENAREMIAKCAATTGE